MTVTKGQHVGAGLLLAAGLFSSAAQADNLLNLDYESNPQAWSGAYVNGVESHSISNAAGGAGGTGYGGAGGAGGVGNGGTANAAGGAGGVGNGGAANAAGGAGGVGNGGAANAAGGVGNGGAANNAGVNIKWSGDGAWASFLRNGFAAIFTRPPKAAVQPANGKCAETTDESWDTPLGGRNDYRTAINNHCVNMDYYSNAFAAAAAAEATAAHKGAAQAAAAQASVALAGGMIAAGANFDQAVEGGNAILNLAAQQHWEKEKPKGDSGDRPHKPRPNGSPGGGTVINFYNSTAVSPGDYQRDCTKCAAEATAGAAAGAAAAAPNPR